FDAVLLQVIAGVKHLFEGGELEGEMVQALVLLGVLAADQRQAVVIAVAAQEHHAARHLAAVVDVGHLEAQHVGVEARRALEVGGEDHGMADLAHGEGGSRHRTTFPCRYHERASSSRSSPQNSSLPTLKVGEPKMPRSRASAVAAS